MSIPAGILAGGLGRRMAGFDKPFAPLGGQPLIAHVIARLVPQTSRIVINANGDPGRFSQFGYPVAADTIPGFKGPLAGIHALLGEAAKTGAAHQLIVPADTPFLPSNLVERLTASPAEAGTVRVAASAGRRHPVVALWPTSLARHLADHLLATVDLSMAAFLRTVAVAEVDFAVKSGADPFFNVNAPPDLEQAERLLGLAAGPKG